MKLFTILFCTCVISCKTDDHDAAISFPPGGYNFAREIEIKDSNFSCYPLKDSISRRDSFTAGFYGYYFFKAFKEPNLSLRPSASPVFRFTYESGHGVFIITLTDKNIFVKKWVSGYIYPEQDEDKLTETEKIHYYALKRSFPLDETKSHPPLQRRVDSLVKLYPQLLSAAYYRSLVDKITDKKPYAVSFTTEKIALSKKKFTRLVNLINSSGYWQMPYYIECATIPTDGAGFSLEANTGYKYNIVKSTICSDTISNFSKICQEIIKHAKPDDSIHLVWR